MSSTRLAFSSAGSSTRLYSQTFRREYQDDSIKVGSYYHPKNYLAVQKNLLCLHKERNCNRSDSPSFKAKVEQSPIGKALGPMNLSSSRYTRVLFVNFSIEKVFTFLNTCLVCQLVNRKNVFFFQHMSCLSNCKEKEKCVLSLTHVFFVKLTTLQLKKEKLFSRCAVLLNRPYCEEISIRFPFRNYQYTKTPPVNSASAMSVDTKSTNRHQMAKLFNPNPVRFPHTLILLTVPPP